MKVFHISSVIAAGFLVAGVSGIQAQSSLSPTPTPSLSPTTSTSLAPSTSSSSPQSNSTLKPAANQNQLTTSPNSARDLAPGHSISPPRGHGGVLPGQSKTNDLPEATKGPGTQSTTDTGTGTQKTTDPNAAPSTRDQDNPKSTTGTQSKGGTPSTTSPNGAHNFAPDPYINPKPGQVIPPIVRKDDTTTQSTKGTTPNSDTQTKKKTSPK